ncbi:MAG: sigma 54-interacting transcriptional regulator [Victivallaceae bacterium]|nr:sigma 54-interacting transcriptional regulator [Victivallaceae bacterium]
MEQTAKNSFQQSQTEAILESISDGVFAVDTDWNITSFNRAAENITGTLREAALGRPCAEVFRSSMCEGECALRQTIEQGEPIINHHCYIINPDGERIPISVSTAVLRNANGGIIGGVETFRDLREVEILRKELEEKFQLGDMVSKSHAMRSVFEIAEVVADSASTVLIQGETGTGKELLARAIHSMGERSERPFIAVNCGALPDSLLESELFGYKKGAFTGATHDKPGRFALAKNGTLFLDEIGEISQALQVRLLRVLQERTYEPLGATATEISEARIIVATNRDLTAMTQAGEFRQDLYYRVNVVQIDLPPLRERLEDVPMLVDHFLLRFNRMQHKNISGISSEALAILMGHDWPGNIRELENVIERAFAVCPGKQLGIKCLPQSLSNLVNPSQAPQNIRSARKITESQTIINALKQNSYNCLAAAHELGIHKTTLYRKIKQLDIKLIK